MTYTTNSYGYKFLTLKPRNNYFIDNIVKFAIVNKKIKINHSWCGDINFANSFNDKTWNIFVLWIDKTKKDEDFIKNKFKNILPLYPVIDKNYILITKIISKQIYEMASTCTITEIGDIYLHDFGAVLASGDIYFPKKFRGSKYPVIWNVIKSDVQHIVPKMHGWFTKNTELLLQYTLKHFDYNVIIELGSWFGMSTSFILQNMKNDTNLYCFDKFQNIANTSYEYENENPMDKFYFTTPRYETFCKNVSPYLTEKKRCYTIKYDVNDFMIVLNHYFIIPNIIFIDAIKNKYKLIKILTEIFKNYPEIVVIGDDHVFPSVKEAVKEFIDKFPKISYYLTDDSYLMTFKKLNTKDITNFISKEYYLPKTDKLYLYRMILYKLHSTNVNEIINIFRNNKIDVNKKLYNGNTLYTCIVAEIYLQKRKELIPLKEYIDKNYKIKKIDNVLGLNYTDYMKYNNLFM